MKRTLCFALVLALVSTAQVAAADPIASGPTIVVGYSGDENRRGQSSTLAIVGAGWKWRWDGYDAIDDAFAKASVDISWAVEPLVTVVTGDTEAFELSAVPLFQLRPLGWEGVIPFFEAGIGIAYTDLDGYGLGSHVQFSDNVAIGFAFGSEYATQWTIGYRYRHLSHAGIFGDTNEGLNAHFLAVTIE